MRTFNLRLVLWLAGIFLVSAIVVHFVHDYQVRKNASAFLDRAQKSEAAFREMREKKSSTRDQVEAVVQQTAMHYKRYLALNPDDLGVRITYGRFLLSLPDPWGAYQQFERVLRTDPDDPRVAPYADEKLIDNYQEARKTQIDLARLLRQTSDAIYHINKLLESQKNDPKLFELRGLLQSQEAGTEGAKNAEQSYEEAIQYDPARTSAYFALAMLQRERLNNPDAAKVTIEQMVEANPDLVDAYVARARFLLVLSAADSEPGREKENLAAALKDCEKARELKPDDPNALLVHSQCLQSSAQGILERAARAQEYVRARDLLKRVIELRPENPDLYMNLYNLELLAGGGEDALENSDQGLTAAKAALYAGIDAVPPEDTFKLRLQMADVLVATSGPEEEIDNQLAAMQALRPDSPQIAYVETRRLVVKQQWLAASKALEELRPKLQDSPELINRVDVMLGRCYSQLGDQDLRLDVLRRVVQEKPKDVSARMDIAETLLSLGRLQEALEQYGELVRLRTGSLNVVKRYTQLLITDTLSKSSDKRDWSAVETSVTAVRKNFPDDPWVPLTEAEIWLGKGDAGKAEETLLTARDKSPNQLDLSSALLELAQQQGDWEKASQRLKELEETFGDTYAVRVAKARFLAKQKGKEAVPELAELAKNVDTFSPEDQTRLLWQLARTCLATGALRGGAPVRPGGSATLAHQSAHSIVPGGHRPNYQRRGDGAETGRRDCTDRRRWTRRHVRQCGRRCHSL